MEDFLKRIIEGAVKFEISPPESSIEDLPDQYKKAIVTQVDALLKECKNLLEWSDTQPCVYYFTSSFWWHLGNDEHVGGWVEGLYGDDGLKEQLIKNKSDFQRLVTEISGLDFNFTEFACRGIKKLPLFFKIDFSNCNGDISVYEEPIDGLFYYSICKKNSKEPISLSEEKLKGIKLFVNLLKKYEIYSFYFIPAVGIHTNLFTPELNVSSAGGLLFAFCKNSNCSLSQLTDFIKNFEVKIPKLSLLVTNRFNRLGLVDFYILKEIEENAIRLHALRAAIAAIMSRNFSHNIGSHVLANVTSKINELNIQDNAILFKYIQQRNDFLALVTTEFPSWSYPAWFTKELMRWLYMQKHLLNYIARAEGLMAYTFDGYEEGLSFITKCIRRRNNDSAHEEIISYCSPDNSDCENCNKGGNENKCDLSKDIPIAIPGGILGFHSFYIILENFIRNSAKHSFQSLPDVDKQQGLKITIELIENESTPWEITVKIYDNCTDPNKEDNGETIIKKIEGNIKKKFIDNTGALNKENWGVAEMKIASGFLQQTTIDKIGAAGEENLNIITPVSVEENCKEYLGYEFKMLKPKELLITGREVDESQQKALNKYSIRLDKSYSDSKDVDFEFMVVLDSDKFVQEISGNPDLIDRYPYRLFVVSESEDGLQCNGFLMKRIVVLNKNDDITSKLNGLLNGTSEGESEAEMTKEEEFKLFLYQKWIEHLKGFRKIPDKINLCLKFAADEGQKGSSTLNNIINDVVHSVKETDSLKGCILEEEGIKKVLGNALRKVTGIGDEDYFPDTLPPVIKKENKDAFSDFSSSDPNIIINGDHNGDHNNCICYRRHHPIREAMFSENLSGAADHYPILVNPPQDKYYKQKLIYQMVENGLLRIAVADERVVEGEYNSKARKEFNNQNIKLVYGLNDYQAKIKSDASTPPYINIDTNNNIPDDIDILIIHQGILDSKITWTEDLDREMFIKKLKEKIPMIVITSGRGKPDIPPGTKFLSFSILEECLLSKPVSKFILTQSLMSLKEKKDKEGEIL